MPVSQTMPVKRRVFGQLVMDINGLFLCEAVPLAPKLPL